MSIKNMTETHEIKPVFDDSFFLHETREGFRIAEMTKRYWAVQIRVLSEIDAVCKRHDIRWFANFGTLLGAVRHMGYVPWDDDMDIMMLRKDYKAFMKYAPDELPGSYRVFDVGSDVEYDDPFGRVVNNDRIQFDQSFLAEFYGCPYTSGIDIYPIDGVYEDEADERERKEQVRLIKKIIGMVDNGKTDSAEYMYQIRQIEQKYSVDLRKCRNLTHRLSLILNDLYTACDPNTSKDVAYMSGWASYDRYRFKPEWFKETVYLPFENIIIPVPGNYDEVLRSEYGDYMQIIRGDGVSHPYPVYREQQEILLEYLKANPDDRLLEYIDRTADKHLEHDKQCDEIIDVCDRAITAMASDPTGQASVELARGISSLFDNLRNIILSDFSEKVHAITLIGRIKDILANDFSTQQIEDCRLMISEIRECTHELYRGKKPIESLYTDNDQDLFS